MIERIILEYLSGQQTAPVYTEIPVKHEADEYIIIERTGGSERNKIREATVAVQTIAGSMFRAAEMAESIREIMLGIVSLPSVFHCSVNAGPYNFTDTDTNEYRYQTVYTVNY